MGTQPFAELFLHFYRSRPLLALRSPASKPVTNSRTARAALLFAIAALGLGPISKADSPPISGQWTSNYARSVVHTSSGNIYAVIGFTNTGISVYESTNNGASWSQQDAAHSPANGFYLYPSAAIDGNGVIHIAYWNQLAGLRYVTFSTATNTFSGDTAVVSYGSEGANYFTAIAVDSNNASHIVYDDYVKSGGNYYNTVTYIDNVGSRWNSKVVVYGAPSRQNGLAGDILINQNNIPEISFQPGNQLGIALGNANKATSFTNQVLSLSLVGNQFPSIVMDSSNNTWVAYLSGSSQSTWVPAIVKHNATDPWSTWQSPVQDSSAVAYPGGPIVVSLAASGTTLYIAYPGPNNLSWQSYNGSSWSVPENLQPFGNSPVLKWSEWFNNGGSSEIDVLITAANNPFLFGPGPSGAYWNVLGTTVSRVSPSVGAIGSSVTITGADFGPTQGTSTVTFNGQAAAVSSWNDGSIVVTVPAGAASGPVVVTVNGLLSICIDGSRCTFSVGPWINSLQPNSGTTGTSVTVNGTGFGSSQGNSTIAFNGVAATATNWNATSITASVPTGATTGPVWVVVGSSNSNPVSFAILGAISGTVTNAANGSGISGATVQILQSNASVASTTTAADGSYAVSSLPTATYDVRFSASGFGTAVVPGNAIVSGASTTVNASLTSPGTISGQVTQSDGVTPISGATVGAGGGSSSAGSTTTDANGNYSISGLGAASYTVTAAASGFATQSLGGISVTAGNTTTENFSLATASQSVISYFYDGLGRLTGASDSQGNTATYSYDAVGNLLSVSVDPSSQVSIASFDPVSGSVGTSVTISGTGFSTTTTQDTVTFNGVAATVTSASATQLLVTVPAGATTGSIQVTTPGGSATSSSSFTVH